MCKCGCTSKAKIHNANLFNRSISQKKPSKKMLILAFKTNSADASRKTGLFGIYWLASRNAAQKLKQ